MTFTARRWLAGALTAFAAGVITGVLLNYGHSLDDTYYVSGWILLGIMVLLAAYNIRKKLAYPPLISSAAWLQAHIYVGLLSIFVFLFHTNFRWPNGPFEVTLAVLFLLVAGSGILGVVLSRAVPSRLAETGEEVLFERIPTFVRRLRKRAEDLVVETVHESETTTLSDFYRTRLSDYFHGPRHFWRHLCQSSRPARKLTEELRSLYRYLDEDERAKADELHELIESKDNLDYHYAMQGALKGWLFAHIPLTYALVVFLAVHVVLVHTYVGGVT